MSKGELIDILVNNFDYDESEISSYSKQVLNNLYNDLSKFK